MIEVRRRSGPQLMLVAALGVFNTVLTLSLFLAQSLFRPGASLVLFLGVGIFWTVWISSAGSWLRGVPAALFLETMSCRWPGQESRRGGEIEEGPPAAPRVVSSKEARA